MNSSVLVVVIPFNSLKDLYVEIYPDIVVPVHRSLSPEPPGGVSFVG